MIQFPSGLIITSNESIDCRLILTNEEMLAISNAIKLGTYGSASKNVGDFNMPDKYFCISKDNGRVYYFFCEDPSDETKHNDWQDETGYFKVSEYRLDEALAAEIARAIAREDDIDDRALHKKFVGEVPVETVEGIKIWYRNQEFRGDLNLINTDINGVKVLNTATANIGEANINVANIITENVQTENIDTINALHANINEAHVGTADINTANIENGNIENETVKVSDIVTANINKANIDTADVLHAHIGDETVTSSSINDADIATLDVTTKAEIKEASIETAAIDTETVTNSNIDDAKIRTEEVGTSNITTANINHTLTNLLDADDANIDTLDVNVKANINDESVGTSDIGTAGIGTANIGTANIGVKANINEAAIGTAGIGDADIATLDVTTKANINDEAVGTSAIGTLHVTETTEVDGNITTHSDLYVEAQKTAANTENALKINSSGKVEKVDLTTASPAKNGKTLEYIDSVSQDSIGKISATKKEITLTDGGQGTLALNDSDITITNLTTSGKPTFTGVTLSSAPSANTDATTKKYVDDADSNLQSQIDTIESRTDVIDVVACYDYNNYEEPKPTSDIVHYNTASGKISDKDVVKVLIDETHNDTVSYYRYSASTSSFSYVGSVEAYYTKAETDNFVSNLQEQIDKDIEVVPYQTTTALTDKQIEKAKAGKLAILRDNKLQTIYSYFDNEGAWFTHVRLNGTTGGVNVPNVMSSSRLNTYLDFTTKKLSEYSSGNYSTLYDHGDNFISNTTIPAADEKQLIRALNLRKTQDMLADIYDATATYAYGDYCIYQNDFYKCTTAITIAEAWNSAHWTKMTIADYCKEADIEVINYNNYTADNSLSDTQIEKAKMGKLIVQLEGMGGDVYARSCGEIYQNQIFFRACQVTNAQNLSYINNGAHVRQTSCYLYVNNKKLAEKAAWASYNVVTDNENNFANNTDIDLSATGSSGKLIMRAKNLRKTQDMIADVYNATKTYAVGDCVIYQNNLYKCNTAISVAEAWTAAHWTKTSCASFDKVNLVVLAKDEYITNHTFTAEEIALLSDASKICAVSQSITNEQDRYFVVQLRYNGGIQLKLFGTSLSWGPTQVSFSTWIINTQTGVCTSSSDVFLGANLNTTSSDNELTSFRNGGTTYKVLHSEQFYPAYNSTYTYSIGDIVSYKGKFYICISDISTAEAWTAAHWAETNPGTQFIEIASGSSGTLSDLDFAKANAQVSIIKLSGEYFYKRYDADTPRNLRFYKLWKNAIQGKIYQQQIHVNSNKTWQYYDNNYSILETNPTLAGTEAALTGLQVGSTKYKVPTQAQSLAYLTTAPTADNTDGVKLVILDQEPATRYEGYIYIITEE